MTSTVDRVLGTPPRECAHGCGLETAGGKYLPGHDAKHLANLFADVKCELMTAEAALAAVNVAPFNLYNKLVRRLIAAGLYTPEEN